MVYFPTLCLCIYGFLGYGEAHNTIPVRLWPLNHDTLGKEVLRKENAALLLSNGLPQFTIGDVPGLNYNAFRLSEQSNVTISINDELNFEEFLLMGMFYVNVDEGLMLFEYTSNSGLIFRLRVSRCTFFVETPLGATSEQLEKCEKNNQWYTIAIQWESGNMDIMVILADPAEGKGKKILEFDAEDLFDDSEDYLPKPGTLTVGTTSLNRASEFAVCCVRIYEDKFGADHIEKQLYQDCEKQEYWAADTPSPCAMGPCENGGICVVNGTNYYCECRPWYTGIKCETERWLAREHLIFSDMGDVFGSLTPLRTAVNITVRSIRECGYLCLQHKDCLSLTLNIHFQCTLYDDYTSNTDSDARYKYYKVLSNY